MKRTQGKPAGHAFDGPRAGFTGFGGFGAAGSGTSLSYLAEPPSFTAVSDPNVVVSLKNVLKKDSTTKAKALEELLAYVQAHPFDKDGGVEEAILDVWVQLYPRTSIDNSRRVRELTHNVQFELMKSARKRFERHLPKVVAAWLAGLYDRDRVVARAASDGLTSFLSTPEKVLTFWNKCQAQILDYAIEAIQETQDTLSDERSTTEEDAEAKYFRVITASLSLVLGLLQKVEPSNLEKHQSRYDDFFAEENVWKTITFKDSAVRKTVCQLLFASIDRKLPYAESPKAKQAFVTGGLKTNQAGSALEYVRALTKLTQAYPDVWSSSKPPSDSKSPMGRLQAFVAKGSQGSQPKFWEYLDQLLSILPTDLITSEVASQFLTSLKSGITHREEPRTNTSFAWKCYIDTAKRLLSSLPSEDQLPFVQEHLFPLIEQFLFSVSEKTPAIPLGPNAVSILVEAYIATVQSSPPVVSASEEEWNRLASIFCAKISGSLPEVSREYQQSQDKIAEEGRRWFSLVGQIEDKILDLAEGIPDHTADPSLKVITQSISLLESRNLKPYGAARILEYALSTAPRLFHGDGAKKVASFLRFLTENDTEKAISSPSSRHLLSSLHLLGSVSTEFAPIWNLWVNAILELESDTDSALASLISNDRGAILAKGNMDLQKHIIAHAVLLALGAPGTWDLLEAAITYQTLTDSNYRELIQALVEILEKEPGSTESTLQALEIAAKGRPELFSRDENVHTTLVALLLGLSELDNAAVSSKATSIRTLLDSHADGKLPVVAVIQTNLERAGPQSLDIETLVSQAENAASGDIPLEELFPSTNIWMQELAPFLELSLNPSLSITNSIGGAAALVKGASRSTQLRVHRDRKGRAIPTRMAIYASKLSDKLPLSQLPKPFQLELLYLQCLTVQLISDQITCMEDNRLWKTLKHGEAIGQAEEFVTRTRGVLNALTSDVKTWNDADNDAACITRDLVNLLTKHSTELTPRGLYSARALAELIQSLTEAHGASSGLEDSLLKPEILKVGPTTVLPAAALLAGFGETLQPSKTANTFCNRLVSEVAGAKAQGDKTFMTLALLSSCGQIYESGEMPVANNRIVFAVRQITSWLEEPEELNPALCAEICRSLTKLLPCMKDVYGSYWEKTIEFCISLWNRAHEFALEDALPFIHSSLRLYKTLETLQEPNDDLEDAIKEYASAKPRALIELLRLSRDTKSQPLEIVDAMLCREVEKLPLRHVPDLSDIFALVASESRDIQTAAFNLLHRAIPEQQQQLSVDAFLDKTDARLPDELLSLLLDAPTLEKYSDEMLAEFPSPIRSYLLSWKLVFDAYSTPSFKIRNDLTKNLKTGNYVAPLLNFMFDVLGHSAAHPLKLEKVNLTTEHIHDYDVKLAEAEPEEKNMQWLLVHLFYLIHKFSPGLFRAWYTDCRSKQTRIAVESWTTKYFSPLIISDALDEVQEWAANQEPPAMDEQELVVRVGRAAREVTASYEVDEDSAAIAIRIPQNYPIENVSVQGINRVAVNERKWQSWIMTTQGVITFSNGNIIDGLQVFRRNITGALRGHAECAICYSIISTDRRTPDKRCATCKNLFHRSCLYKWFQTSNQNTCPLCRNPIDYLGSDTAKRRQTGVNQFEER